MSNDQSGRQGSGKSGMAGWVAAIVVLLTPLWPLGLVMLIRKLMNMDRQQGTQARHPFDIQQEQRAAGSTQHFRAGASAQPGTQGVPPQDIQGVPLDPDRGKKLAIAGGVLTGIGALGTIREITYWWQIWRMALKEAGPFLALLGTGVAMLGFGLRWLRKSRRFRRYLSLIGQQKKISLDALARAMPVSSKRAREDLQEMLDTGILKVGYLDMNRRELVLTAEGIREEPEPEKQEEEPPLDKNDDNAVLSEIRKVNDAIADETMSRKIDRIGTITGKIFAYQKQNPTKSGELRSFLNYYLPTTLKILKAYAQMEAQGIEGENIRQTRARIEGMMDKVVEGYEKQLDRLFQDRAMDITSDVEVLEQMLEKDGLSDHQGMTMGL